MKNKLIGIFNILFGIVISLQSGLFLLNAARLSLTQTNSQILKLQTPMTYVISVALVSYGLINLFSGIAQLQSKDKYLKLAIACLALNLVMIIFYFLIPFF